MNRIIFQPDGTPMVPIFSPRRRLYEALYEPEAIIPLFHYSNCERSELSSIGFRCRVSGVRKASRKILKPLMKLHLPCLSFFSDQTGRFSGQRRRSCETTKVGVGSILCHFTFCRLGLACSKLCWVSLHSTQPTCCRCYCEMRNPTTAGFQTKRTKFLFRFDRPFFWPAAGLNTDTFSF